MRKIGYRRIVCALSTVAACSATSPCESAPTESQGDIGKMPIAVIKFLCVSGEPLAENKPSEIIANDFAFCGRFAVSLLPKRVAVELFNKKIDYVVEGKYSRRGDSLHVHCLFIDLSKGEILVKKSYRATHSTVRSMAHMFSNAVYDKLFNAQGPFESRILFTCDHGRHKFIHIMDYDGFNIRRVVSMKTINMFPCFVGSDSLVWVTYAHITPDIFKRPVGRGKQKSIIKSRFTETSPAFSSVNNALVYASSVSGDMEIYTSDLNGTRTQRLTNNDAVDISPCWSPDGERIAFVSDRNGAPAIYIMDNNGKNVKRFMKHGGYQDSPAWSPDGCRIAYTSHHRNRYAIWVANADGTHPRQLTDTEAKSQYPTWSPNGSHICFQSMRRGKYDLYRMKADGTGLKQLTTLGYAVMPDWSGK